MHVQNNHLTDLVKNTKENLKELHRSGVHSKYLSVQNRTSRCKLRKRCSEIVDLPYIPSEERQQLANCLLMSESELIEERQEREREASSGSALNFKKAASYNYSTSTETAGNKQLEYKVRMTRMKKLQEEVKTLNRSNMKTGNFVMPKIFDINLNVCLMEERPVERRGFIMNQFRFEQ